MQNGQVTTFLAKHEGSFKRFSTKENADCADLEQHGHSFQIKQWANIVL
jgi:hypothetical protein